MGKLISYILLFLFGVSLALLYAYRGAIIQTVSPYEGIPVEELAPTVSSSESYRDVPFLPSPRMRALLKEELSQKARLAKLRAALRAGTLDSLQLLLPEFLEQLPEYHEEILPVLKRDSLKLLTVMFTERDWKSWLPEAFLTSGSNSKARLFIDDITSVNNELGRYLDTAALLFHGLYREVSKGKDYDAEEDLDFILQNAEEILKARKYTAIPARQWFQREVLFDPVFIEIFEQLRGKLTASYIEQQGSDLQIQLGLVLALNPDYCDTNTKLAVSHLVYRFVLQTSAAFRSKLFSNIKAIEVLESFARSDDRVRVALSRLYLIGAVDALEAGDEVSARRFHQDAVALGAHIPLEQVVGNFLEIGEIAVSEKIHNEADVSNQGVTSVLEQSVFDDSSIEQTGRRSLFADVNAQVENVTRKFTRAEKKESGVSIFGMIVISIFLMIVGVVGFLIWRRRTPDMEFDLSDDTNEWQGDDLENFEKPSRSKQVNE